MSLHFVIPATQNQQIGIVQTGLQKFKHQKKKGAHILLCRHSYKLIGQ